MSVCGVVWMVDIRKRTVRVYTAVDQSVLITKGSRSMAARCCRDSCSGWTNCSYPTNHDWASSNKGLTPRLDVSSALLDNV